VHSGARLRHATNVHDVTVATAGAECRRFVPPKPSGLGSAVNDDELLMRALATCLCNDPYREAARLGIVVDSAEVEANADFEGVGPPATNSCCCAGISARAPYDAVDALLRRTDAAAGIQNTLARA
jgi:hypothetical protein